MKNKFVIPTILGLFVLIFGVFAGVLLINSRQNFKLGATIEASPKNVRITNISNTSLTVSWTTDIPTKGFVKWGNSQTTITKVSLGNSGNNESFIHFVNVLGIDPGSDIYFKINSNGEDFDNNNAPWKAKTLAQEIKSKNNIVASGAIISSNGSTPAEAIVYLTINGIVLSGITSREGNFIIPISNYIESIAENTAINLSVDAGVNGSASAVIYPTGLKAIPTMVLGRTYDFRTLSTEESGSLPESSLSIPEEIERSSRFEISKTEGGSQTTTVSIESIDDGEIITTTDPEFFGSAPTGIEIEISVESEYQSATVTPNTNGRWSWSPPKNLSPGEHKLTIKWRDAQGILRTITRTFIVQAAEGPAFESTPSASLSPSPSATPSNSVTPTATSTGKSSSTPTAKASTASATLAPTPETGNLTATLGLFIMGISLLFGSTLLFKKEHAD